MNQFERGKQFALEMLDMYTNDTSYQPDVRKARIAIQRGLVKS